MFCQTSTQEFLQIEPINDRIKKGNASIMHVGDTILTATMDSGINENWCLLDNQSTFNAFTNVKSLSNIRDDTDEKYPRIHCNTGVTHTKKIGELPGYSDPVWYNPKGIANILYLGLVHKNHLVNYSRQDEN